MEKMPSSTRRVVGQLFPGGIESVRERPSNYKDRMA